MEKIGLKQFLRNRQLQIEQAPQYRILCQRCMHPQFSCYCSTIKTVDTHIQFVILIHPIEFSRRIATGRMSSLCLENSILIKGEDFTNDEKVNQIVSDQKNQCVILYPGKNSINLSALPSENKKKLVDKQKKLTVFVIDGTWATARKMVRKSNNISHLPRWCFNPEKPSNFRVRKQPAAHCLSTIEAIHQFVEEVADVTGFETQSRKHDVLIEVFDQMVEKQIQMIREYNYKQIRGRRSRV